MKICVVGAGAIGGWLAGAFAQAGTEVSLLTRGAALQAIRRDGLRIRRGGEESVYRLDAGDDPAAFPAPDFVVIAVKGHDIPAVAGAVAALCCERTAVLPAINGIPWWFFALPGVPLAGTRLRSVDADGVASHFIDARRVIGCVVHASAASPAPGIVEIKGEDKLLLGEPGGAQSARVAALCDLLKSTTVNPAASGDIRLDIWTKLWGNMTMNPLSVLTGATTGAMLDDPGARSLIRSMMLEMQAMGARIGLPLAMTPEERMAITRKLGDFKTSMLRDAEAGRPLETGPILGALVEIADLLNEPAPFLRAVLGLMRVRAQAL